MLRRAVADALIQHAKRRLELAGEDRLDVFDHRSFVGWASPTAWRSEVGSAHATVLRKYRKTSDDACNMEHDEGQQNGETNSNARRPTISHDEAVQRPLDK